MINIWLSQKITHKFLLYYCYGVFSDVNLIGVNSIKKNSESLVYNSKEIILEMNIRSAKLVESVPY